MLKRMAKSLFKCDISKMVLFYQLEEGDMPTYLDDDAMPLAYFGVPDGATIAVNDAVADRD